MKLQCECVVDHIDDEIRHEYLDVQCTEDAQHVIKMWDCAVPLCNKHNNIFLNEEEIEWFARYDIDQLEILQALIKKE
jgi:hypothetical protein